MGIGMLPLQLRTIEYVIGKNYELGCLVAYFAVRTL